MKRKFKQPLALLTTFVMTLTMLMDLPSGVFERITPKVSAAETTTITPTKPSTDSSGVYQIKTAGELYWFAGLVNGTLTGVSQNTSANAVLTDDIIVNANLLKSLTYDEDGNVTNGSSFTAWTPINNSATDSYAGKFDGQNHTISGLYLNDSEQRYVGLFGSVDGAEIQNTGIIDSYLNGDRFVGGVCGYTKNCKVTNCYYVGTVGGDLYIGGVCGSKSGSSVSITNCYHSGTVSGNKYVGGVCGSSFGGTITNCYHIGAVSGSSRIGGVCGYSTSGEKITNSYHVGAVNGNDVYVGGVCGNNGGVIVNCYHIGAVNCQESTTGGICGRNFKGTVSNSYFSSTDYTGNAAGENIDGTVSDSVLGKATKQFSNGEVAYLLAQGCTIGEGESAVTYSGDIWGQNIGKDTYPTLGSAKVVPSNGQYCNPAVKITADNYGDYGFTADTYAPYVGYYAISSVGELYWFAGLVNGTLTDGTEQNTSANAVLTKDIIVNKNVLKSDGTLADDTSGFTAWFPIGYAYDLAGDGWRDDVYYQGKFDGQNHTISGLYFNNSAQSCVGLFGQIRAAEVKNVCVADSYFNAAGYVGGLCGLIRAAEVKNVCVADSYFNAVDFVGGVCGLNSKGTLTNSYASGSITAIDSRAYAGGVCGENDRGTITNSYASGTITANSDYDYAGGVCGNNTGTITNCYVSSAITANGKGAYAGGVCGNNTGIITNSYFDSDIFTGNAIGRASGTVSDSVLGKATKQFSNGEVAYLLSQGCTVTTTDDDNNTVTTTYSGSGWGQDIGKDAYPTLGGAKVVPSNGQYCNPAVKITADNYSKYGFTADTYAPYVGYYAISSVGELYWFAGLVNGMLTDGTEQNASANAVLTDDIIVNANLLESLAYNTDGEVTNGDSFTAWFPIGYFDDSNEAYYQGKFDGQNHTISGLYFNNSAQSYVGLFGQINGAEIKNVGVEDSYFNADGYVGGVCGSNYGTITNSYHIGTVSVSYYCVGGVCGSNGGTITNSYHIGAVNGSDDYSFGGVCGSNGGTITNSYFDSTVYTGNAVGENSDGAVSDDVLGKTTTQFQSGEVAYLLAHGCTVTTTDDDNNTVTTTYSGSVWGQDLSKKDSYPTLGAAEVVRLNGKYCNSTPAVQITADNYSDYGFTADTYAPYVGYYAISNADELYWFAWLVDGTLTSVTKNYAANAVLTKDITVNANLLESLVYDEDGNVTNGDSFTAWTPIGSISWYEGSFDGQNHTISGLYYNDHDYKARVGLFGGIGGAKVKNVGVVDSYFDADGYVGGVCGNSKGMITNCYYNGAVATYTTTGTSIGGVCGYSSGTITNSYASSSITTTITTVDGSLINVGGVCGYSSGTITNSYASSSITTTITTVDGSLINVGGVCGAMSVNRSATTLVNCYYNGSITATSESANVGGVCGYIHSGTITNSYFDSTVYTGNAVGLNDYGTVSDNVLGKTTVQFASGEVAYLLAQGCTVTTTDDDNNTVTTTYSGDIWGQTLTGDNKQDHPVLGGAKVALSDTQYVNVKQPEQITADNYGDYGFTADTYAPYVGYYAISSVGELYWFAGLVNGTLDVSQNTSANAVLTKDIIVNTGVLKSDGTLADDTSAFAIWSPIGHDDDSEDLYYQGKFDGQNHTISGLYYNDQQARVGLFGGISGAEIKNVGVVDSYFRGAAVVGGVCGENQGTITNSYHIGAVRATSYVGGVCGENKGTITNSYHIGTVRGSNCSGGVCGMCLGGTITNCYHIGTVSGSSTRSGGVCGCSTSGTIINSYYDSDICTRNAIGRASDTVSDSVLGKTTKQFNNGEVAYLLAQGCTIGEGESAVTYSGDTWGQTLTGDNKQDHPVLSGAKVYQVDHYHGSALFEKAYSNTSGTTYENNVNGKCTVCGHFENGIGAKLAGYTLSLSGNIGVNFYMELDADVIADTGAYMQFTLPNGTTLKVYVKDVETDTTTTAGTTYYIFSCEVAAKEMYADIQAQIMLSDGSSSDVYTFKVEDYANYILDDDNGYDEKTQDLVTAMLNYGSFAKAYFNEETLSATTEMESIAANTLSGYAFTATGTLPEGITYYGSTLILESETAIRHYFKVAEGTDISAYHMVAKDGFYYMQFSNIAADDLGTARTTTIGEYSISYSAMSYAYAVLNGGSSDQNLINLVKALTLYEQAATVYQQN